MDREVYRIHEGQSPATFPAGFQAFEGLNAGAYDAEVAEADGTVKGAFADIPVEKGQTILRHDGLIRVASAEELATHWERKVGSGVHGTQYYLRCRNAVFYRVDRPSALWTAETGGECLEVFEPGEYLHIEQVKGHSHYLKVSKDAEGRDFILRPTSPCGSDIK